MPINEQFAREAVVILDWFIKADPQAAELLLTCRVPCNDKTAGHPSIQVGDPEDKGRQLVGVIGLLNGIAGVNDDGCGAIAVYQDENGVPMCAGVLEDRLVDTDPLPTPKRGE